MQPSDLSYLPFDPFSFLDQYPDIVAFFGPEYRYIYGNQAFKDAFAVNFSVIPRPGDVLLYAMPEALAQEWRSHHERAFSGERFQEHSEINDGNVIRCYVTTIGPIYGKEGSDVVAMSVFGQDVTAFKLAEQALESSHQLLHRKTKRLEEFSGMVAHNVRAPLSNVMSLLNLINHSKDTADKDDLLAMLQTSLHQLNGIIKDLTEVAVFPQFDDKSYEMVSFQSVLDDCLQGLSALLKETGIEIKTDFELSEVRYVKKYIYSIFLNLISNAIKYRDTSKNPILTISTFKVGRKNVLKFEDNGLGMNMNEVAHKIFKPYKTFHNKPESKGLGLFLIRSQLEMLGGTIEVRSEQGVGTIFELTL